MGQLQVSQPSSLLRSLTWHWPTAPVTHLTLHFTRSFFSRIPQTCRFDRTANCVAVVACILPSIGRSDVEAVGRGESCVTRVEVVVLLFAARRRSELCSKLCFPLRSKMCLLKNQAASTASRNASSSANPQSEVRVPLTDDHDARRNFRIVTHVVTAAKRFQASLNPTISFKKRNSDEDDMWRGAIPDRTQSEASALAPRPSPPKTLSGPMRQLTRTPSGRWVPRRTYEQRGHMTGYLLMPLPELRASS